MASRKLLCSLILALTFHGCQGTFAQDDPSQRLLPLPESRELNMAQHMELLRRMRSLVEAQQSPPETGRQQPASKGNPQSQIPPEHFQQLQNAIKNLADKLPPGFVPPDLNSVPPEQLKNALENPAVQQQMKDMLEQFSRDGLLPPTSPNGSPSPLPPRSPSPGTESPSSRPAVTPDPFRSGNRNPPNGRPSDPAETDRPDPGDPSEMPQGSLNSLQDFLKKLTENPASPESPRSPQSRREPVPPRSTPTSPSIRNLQPKQPLRRKDRMAPGDDFPKGNSSFNPARPGAPEPGTEPLPPNQPPSDSRPGSVPDGPRPTPGADSSPRSSNPTQPQNSPDLFPADPSPADPSRPDPSQPDAARADLIPSTPQDPRAQNPVLRARDPESARQQFQDLQKAIERMQEMSEQSSPTSPGGRKAESFFPPGSASRIPQSPDGFGQRNTPLPQEKSVDKNQFPEVADFLKEQLKDLKLAPPMDQSRGAGPLSRSGPDSRLPDTSPRTVPGIFRGVDPSRGQANPPVAGNSPPIDIKQELERRGFGETLKKIVRQAQQESRQPGSSSQMPAGPNGGGTSGNAQGQPGQTRELSDSVVRVLDSLKEDLEKRAREQKSGPPPRGPDAQRMTPRNAPSGSKANSNSALSGLRKAASDFLTGPSSPRNSPTGSSGGSGSSVLDAQFDVTPALVLAAILLVAGVGFYGLRYVKLRTAQAVAMQTAGPPIRPSDIRSRADVIRAFHEFAMRSTKSVQSWWTHRAVQRLVAESAPNKQAAVETLANAYEEARYLPQEHELTTEQIQSARVALQQCIAGV